MIIGDKLIGMLTLDYNIAGFYTSRHVRIAEVFAIQAAAALANAALFEDLAKHVEALKESEDRLREANAELQRLSMTDELTGLYNRRGFMMLAERFLDSNRRNNIQSVLVYIDLDHLKRINDTHGHDAGDRAIIRFAEILERTLRKSDVGARIGGDEFAFITGVPEPDAVDRILERLDGALAEFNASGEDVFTLSATGGSAFIDVDSDASLEDGLREADENLYRKKQARR